MTTKRDRFCDFYNEINRFENLEIKIEKKIKENELIERLGSNEKKEINGFQLND